MLISQVFNFIVMKCIIKQKKLMPIHIIVIKFKDYVKVCCMISHLGFSIYLFIYILVHSSNYHNTWLEIAKRKIYYI
jgi:hypothetical protein